VSARPCARSLAALTVLTALAAAVVALPLRAQPAPADSDCASFSCGRVESIRQTTIKQPWTPIGTASSFNGDARAVTTFQIGPGGIGQGPVLLGAGGGAVYRRTPEAYEQPRWEVTVKLDSGQKRVVSLAYEPFVREGDRVRVAGNSLELIN